MGGDGRGFPSPKTARTPYHYDERVEDGHYRRKYLELGLLYGGVDGSGDLEQRQLDE
jgi:hypothetical protein